MDGHQIFMILDEENPYSGADYDVWDGDYNGGDIIDKIYASLLVPLFTYWLSIGYVSLTGALCLKFVNSANKKFLPDFVLFEWVHCDIGYLTTLPRKTLQLLWTYYWYGTIVGAALAMTSAWLKKSALVEEEYVHTYLFEKDAFITSDGGKEEWRINRCFLVLG